jgi:hypothetical protein
MPSTRHTLAAAAAALFVAAAPLHAQTVTLAKWSYAGPQVCTQGWDPMTTTWPVGGSPAWLTVMCASRFDALVERTPDGEHYLRVSTDLSGLVSPTNFSIGELVQYYDMYTMVDVYPVLFGVPYRFGTQGWDAPGPWLFDLFGKPQTFSGISRYWLDIPDADVPDPMLRWAYADVPRLTLQPVPVRAVPEPATLVLVASGALLVGGIARRRRRV